MTSNNQGPIHGTLVFGRSLDQNFIKYLSEKSDSKITFKAVDPSFSPPSDHVASLAVAGSPSILLSFTSGKDEFTQLEKSFNHMMSTLEQAQAAVQFQAEHDTLTGLPNRMALFKYLDYAIADSRKLHSRFAVFFIDLDHFKLINDTLGHHVGDLLLSDVAERLQFGLKNADFLGRLGGDEFCIVSHNVHDANQIEYMAGMIKEKLNAPFYLNGHEFVISASIGISLYPDHGIESERLLQFSDAAMFDVKETGKNNYRMYTDAIQSPRTR